ncbi:MAG: neutral/alkaline non-lysosomal ceramidase N-terminal domain-containing protein [Actinobacteria bacterium]|nr:neutral/alkaline non-lysosomal ceramidase N-terminal domain-containing protein [Actinomycetota bacterium]
MPLPEVIPYEGLALIGISRRDVTPPVGIYGRMWGASNHDKSEGTHKPLYITAMSIQADSADLPAILMTVDAASLGDLDGREALWLRREITRALEIDDSHLMLACSHTHASPWFARSRSHLPGGHLIEKYLQDLAISMVEVCKEATALRERAIITFKEGNCTLATNRDFPDPHDPTRYLTGFNPDVTAEETLLVGRVSRVLDGKVIGTIVNYACHPTSLGWENRLVSPDYVGAMREIVEREYGGAPCLFLQGASGDLAPAYQYVAETKVADSHGYQLGFAAMATLSSLNSAGHKLAFDRAVESGAPLAFWEPKPYAVPEEVVITADQVALPTKTWPSIGELDDQLSKTTDSFARERIFRKRSIAKMMTGGSTIDLRIYGWRVGKILFVGVQCEVYSIWQRKIRELFPDYAVIAITCVDYEAIGYVVPDHLHDRNLYTAWQPPFGKGVMQALLEGSAQQLRKTFS